MADSAAGRFDVLLVEALDRLSRDQVEMERTLRRLEHRGIRVVGISDGYDTRMGGRKVLRTMRGLVAELYLDDLRAKTHRGLSGRVDRGYSTGGRAFGYRTEPDIAADGTTRGHRLVIDEAEAEIVRWIFDRSGSDGWPARRIVHDLNARGVASPRGSTWAVSGLYGNPSRGIGLLNNEMYVGVRTWNRTQWVRDPETGKRTWRERPQSEWKIEARPDLRIVSDEQWQRVRARMGRPRAEVGTKGAGRPARTLFAGILRCSACGGPMAAINGRQYGCVARKDRGPSVCSGVTAPREALDDRLLATVREEILSPEALVEAQRVFTELAAERRRGVATAEAQRRRRLVELDGEIDRLVTAVVKMGASDALAARLRAAEAERASLAATAAEGAQQADEYERAARAAFANYRGMRISLDEALRRDLDRARLMLSDLLGSVRVESTETGEVWAEIGGAESAAEKKQAAQGGLSLMLVAGAGFEPATFGL